MNKLHFFNKLEKNLKYLEINDIDEIIRDYEEYFLEQEKKGQTEEEIINSLEDPSTIAMQYNTKEKNRNIKAEKIYIKYNITQVTLSLVQTITASIGFLGAAILFYIVDKSIGIPSTCFVISIIFLLLAISNYKKRKRYKDQLDNLDKYDI